jgi:hypothetical protein
MRVLEAGLVAALAGLVSIILITNINACTNKKPYDDLAIVAQVCHSFVTSFCLRVF